MLIYKYNNYISSDKEKLEEHILDDIEETQDNLQTIFQYMKEADIFLEYCGVDNE